MTTTSHTADSNAPRGDPHASEPDRRPPPVWSSRIRRFLLGTPRTGETDTRFGRRLALYGPLAFSLVLFVILVLFRVEGEAGLGLTLSYWLFIGASQLLYLGPSIVLALLMRRRGIAVGLLQGGALIAGVNVAAWVIGYYFIGVR